MKSHSILLIDDEKDLRQAISDFLSVQGYKVVEASNGNEGLQLYKQNYMDIRLIITDIQMPVMNGYEFLNSLLELDSKLKINNPKIIVVSGHSPYSIEELKAVGVSSFIEKPFGMQSILKEIENSSLRAS